MDFEFGDNVIWILVVAFVLFNILEKRECKEEKAVCKCECIDKKEEDECKEESPCYIYRSKKRRERRYIT